MLDFMFFVKTLIVTVLLVSLMQIKAGEMTIENHAAHWVKTTPLTEPLRSTAEAGAKAVSDSARWLSAQVQKQTRRIFGKGKSEGAPGGAFNLRRSDGYEQEKKAKQEAALKRLSDSEESE